MFGGTLHKESWPELYPPPPGSQRTSVGGFVEGTQSSTFLLVTLLTRGSVLANWHQAHWEKPHTLSML